MTTTSPTTRSRDREGTQRAILTAARDVLAEEGFSGFGINAIARRAGCDKQLVYRYFGGIEGLIDAIGADLAQWLDRHLAEAMAEAPAATYAALMERLALGFLEALRADPLVQKIAAWELSDASPEVRRLSEARSRALGGWMQRMRGDLVPPPGIDAPAANALLIAAIQHLVLSAATAGSFSGLALATDGDWDRIRASLKRVIAALYS